MKTYTLILALIIFNTFNCNKKANMKNPFKVIEAYNIEKMKYLLDKGLDVNKKNFWGVSLIEKALKDKIYNIAQVLYQYDADINKIKNNYSDVIFFDNEKQMEDQLFIEVTNSLKIFAKSNNGDRFYGFAFEYRYEYGSILFSLNSIEDFNNTPKEYQDESPKEYNDEKSISELKWNPSDWKYQAFHICNYLVKFNEKIFLSIINKVKDRMKKEQIFNKMKITNDFNIIISNYD